MNIVSLGFQDKTLQQADLANPEKDENMQSIVKWRCEHFKIPELEIGQIVDSGKPISEAINVAVSAFDKHVGNEKRIIETYQTSIQDLIGQRYTDLAKEKADLSELENDEQDRVSGKTIVNIPPHFKFEQRMWSVFAWILVAAGIVQLAIFLHNQNGMEWWQAFVIPFSGVVGLSLVIKTGLPSLYKDCHSYYKVVKYSVLLAGMGFLASWVVLYSQYAVTLAQGPQFTTLDGAPAADSGGHGSHIMVALQILGEAFVAGALFARANEITAEYTTRDGIEYTPEYKLDLKEVEQIEKELEFFHSRKAHADSLLSMLEASREDVEEKSKAVWNDLRCRKK